MAGRRAREQTRKRAPAACSPIPCSDHRSLKRDAYRYLSFDREQGRDLNLD
jgi:hypothetical protein